MTSSNYKLLTHKYKTDLGIIKILEKEMGKNFINNMLTYYSLEDVVNKFIDVDMMCSILGDNQ